MMKLSAFKRSGNAKSEKTKLRIQKDIPAVVYGPKHKSENIFIKGADFSAILRQLPKGKLSNTLFQLTLDGKEYSALVKDIQYHRTTYEILHLDFMTVEKDHPVDVAIPIECVHVADCAGIKLGGNLRQVIRSLKVRCLPKDIPQAFTIDVKNLNILDSVKLSQLTIPSNVRALANLEEVAVVIAKR